MRLLGVGCGFLAFCAFCLVGLSASAIHAFFAAPTDAAAQFLADVRRDDFASALARTSSEYQGSHTAADLPARIAALPLLDTHAFATLTSYEEVEADRARVEGTIYADEGSAPIAFELSERNGYWYIDLVVVGGTPLE